MSLAQALLAATLGYLSMFVLGIAVSMQSLWARMTRRGLDALREEFSGIEGWPTLEAEIEARWRRDLIIKTVLLINILTLLVFLTLWAGIVVASSGQWWGHLLAFGCGGAAAIAGLIYLVDARVTRRPRGKAVPTDWEMFTSLYRARLKDTQSQRDRYAAQVAQLRDDRDAALEEWMREHEIVEAQEAQMDRILDSLDLANSRLPSRARVFPDQPDTQADPAADFLAQVEAAWRRRLSDADRATMPLAPMTVGWAFLESFRDVHVAPEKVAEVCMEVATGLVFRSHGRDAHRLRAGKGASDPPRERSTDGARGWRCALKKNSPAAPRLHWWALPDGGVEFAACVLHDDMRIPE